MVINGASVPPGQRPFHYEKKLETRSEESNFLTSQPNPIQIGVKLLKD